MSTNNINDHVNLDDLELFSLLAIEEFLMKKNVFPETLAAFRREWSRPPQNEAAITWYDVASKLRLNTFHTIDLESSSVLENIIETQVKNSSIKTRRPQSAISSALLRTSTAAPLPSMKSTSKLHISKQIRQENRREPDIKFHDSIKDPNMVALPKPAASKPSSAQDRGKEFAKSSYEKRNKKQSSLNWIPEALRFEDLSRNLRLAQENINDYNIRERSMQYHRHHRYCSDLEEAKAQENIGMTKKIACGCCNQMFLYVNLPQSVSMKAIIDIRAKWAGNMKPSSIYKSNENGILVKFSESITKVSSVYDQVRVCVFCAQFFNVQEGYRPAYSDLVVAEKMHRENERQRVELEYWDPLKMCEKNRDELERENPTYISAHGPS